MKATITITTPAGRVLEGFPLVVNFDTDHIMLDLSHDNVVIVNTLTDNEQINLHPGDKITIEITE